MTAHRIEWAPARTPARQLVEADPRRYVGSVLGVDSGRVAFVIQPWWPRVEAIIASLRSGMRIVASSHDSGLLAPLTFTQTSLLVEGEQIHCLTATAAASLPRDGTRVLIIAETEDKVTDQLAELLVVGT